MHGRTNFLARRILNRTRGEFCALRGWPFVPRPMEISPMWASGLYLFWWLHSYIHVCPPALLSHKQATVFPVVPLGMHYYRVRAHRRQAIRTQSQLRRLSHILLAMEYWTPLFRSTPLYYHFSLKTIQGRFALQWRLMEGYAFRFVQQTQDTVHSMIVAPVLLCRHMKNRILCIII